MRYSTVSPAATTRGVIPPRRIRISCVSRSAGAESGTRPTSLHNMAGPCDRRGREGRCVPVRLAGWDSSVSSTDATYYEGRVVFSATLGPVKGAARPGRVTLPPERVAAGGAVAFGWCGEELSGWPSGPGRSCRRSCDDFHHWYSVWRWVDAAVRRPIREPSPDRDPRGRGTLRAGEPWACPLVSGGGGSRQVRRTASARTSRSSRYVLRCLGRGMIRWYADVSGEAAPVVLASLQGSARSDECGGRFIKGRAGRGSGASNRDTLRRSHGASGGFERAIFCKDLKRSSYSNQPGRGSCM